ncbi:sulfur carrier protein ThiS [Telmatospirillum sp.]|uniref:sulfur carrier protein ThiS n=1 Tax=Telmatospirillum sp. TaxID=2079197 RepID=UPI00284B74ED|nr:sulfur carrier protein ThiS [Telmatospirillum sp.]MDR3437438.1 sulfur carrier protein ThiS [Telmatospirillum sp.]
MIIKVNGERYEVAAPRPSLSEILSSNGVQAIETVSVQVNGEFVDPNDYSTVDLKPDDEVDFLYFLGGGSSR